MIKWYKATLWGLRIAVVAALTMILNGGVCLVQALRTNTPVPYMAISLLLIPGTIVIAIYMVRWEKSRLVYVKKGDIVIFEDGRTSEVLEAGRIKWHKRCLHKFTVRKWLRTESHPSYYVHGGKRVYEPGAKAVMICPRWGRFKRYYDENDRKNT